MNKTKRWSEKQGREAIAQWRRSGLSMSGFARKRGLNAQRLRYWRDRVEGDRQEWRGRRAVGAKLVPGVVVGLGTGAAVRVQLPGGVLVEIWSPGDVAAQWVAQVVHALEVAR